MVENRAVKKGAFSINRAVLGLIGIILSLSGLCFALVKDLNALFVVFAFVFLFFGAVICLFLIVDSITCRL